LLCIYVKFSSYHYHNHRQNVICSSSIDKTIRFWDFKHNSNYKYSMDTLVMFVELNFHHLMVVDINVLDHMTKQFVYGMLKHQNHYMFSMDMKVLNNNNNNNKKNNIGVIDGNGYTICSGSFDKTIRIWDIETTKQTNVFKGHDNYVNS
ncbi:hypothetical protein RFI_32607, partial [Reticulomyxa filosa]